MQNQNEIPSEEDIEKLIKVINSEMDVVRDNFLEYQKSLNDTVTVVMLTPMFTQFASYCNEFIKTINGTLEVKEEEKEIFELTRDMILTGLVERWKQKR